MMRYTSGFAVDEVFITHFHADHTLGIPGLLRTMGLQGRTAPLRLYGPRGAQRQIGALTALGMERPKFAVEIFELQCRRRHAARRVRPDRRRGAAQG